MNLYYLIFVFMPHISFVHSQASISKVSTNKVKCGKEFSLRCDYTGALACCDTFPRVWSKNGVIIYNNGAETGTTGKYTESKGSNTFELKIKSASDSDFDTSYKCQYSSTESSALTLNKNDNFYCPPCWNIYDLWGWAMLGAVIFLSVAVIFACIAVVAVRCKCDNSHQLKEYTWWQIVLLVFTVLLASFCVVAPLAMINAPVCIIEIGLGAVFIVTGLVAVPFFLLFLCVIWPKCCKKGNNGRDGDGDGGHQARFACCNGNKVCVSSDVDEKSRSLPNKEKERKPKVTKKKPEKEGKSKHVGTENDGKRAFSAEERDFTTPRDPPKNPRPLPKLELQDQKARGNQLPPLQTDISETTEKKKKKKRKPKNEENNKAYDED